MAAPLSPAQRLALQQQDAQFLSRALETGASPRSMAAHLRQAVRLAAISCSDATAYLNDLYERSVPPEQNARLACRAGCAHCCVQRVQVFAAEAFFIATALRERPDTAAASRAAALTLKDNPATRFVLRCPMLQDDKCSIYAVRPLSCHAFVSQDVSDCISVFENEGPLTIRAPQIFSDLRNIIKLMGLSAMRLAGVPAGPGYEMNGAVAAVLAQDDAEARWRRGEDIFAGVTAYPLSASAEHEVARMAAYVAPTL